MHRLLRPSTEKKHVLTPFWHAVPSWCSELSSLCQYASSSSPQQEQQQQSLRRVDYRPGCSLRELIGNQEEPAVINGAMTNEEWPSLRWSPDELLRRSSDLTVPVEVSIGGGDYRDMYCPQPGSSRAFEAGVPVPLSLLLQHMRDEEQHMHEYKASPSTGAEQQSAHQHSRQQPRLYLAQKSVAEVLPALAMEGVPLDPPFAELAQRMHQCSVWLGPRGTQTPLHCDPYYNLFCQVWGAKDVRMYNPQLAPSLHPYATPFLRNTSQVSAHDVQAHSDFGALPYFACRLRAGEMLYIPRKWWHHVASVTASLSISYWWV